MIFSKRQTLAAVAVMAFAAAGLAVPAGAQPAEPSGTVNSSRILETLQRDIVLDRPGTPAPGAPAAPVAQPSMDLFVQFAFNSAELAPQGRKQLDELGRALNNRSLAKWGFELAGHTDAVGSAEYNLKLSLERANAVKHYLVVKHGLNPNRLVPIGFGFSRPAYPADPAAAVNRRVEVRRVALNDGRAVTLGQSGDVSAPVLGAPAPTARPATGGRLVATP